MWRNVLDSPGHLPSNDIDLPDQPVDALSVADSGGSFTGHQEVWNGQDELRYCRECVDGSPVTSPIPVSFKNFVVSTLLLGLYICFVRKLKVLW
jgi:hypothetical protein